MFFIRVAAPYRLVAWPPCRLVEVLVECKRDINASRALLVLERTILKRKAGPLYSLVAWPPCRLVDVLVECKRDLNASRALLVLERTILKRKAGTP